MTTSRKSAPERHLQRRLGDATCAALLVTIAVALTPAHAQQSSLVERCFPASELSARPDEKPPRRGAEGHAQSIPKLDPAPPTPVPQNLRGAIRRVDLPPGKKLIALTLDMCEQNGEIAGYDGAIIDILRKSNVPATIFAGGKWLMTHGERSWQLIADQRFEMGNHGWAHRNVRGLSAKALLDEIEGPQASFTLRRAQLETKQCTSGEASAAMTRIPQRLGLYRFPFGACNPESLALVANRGMLAIQWDVSTGDATKSASPRLIADTVTRGVKPGSIILAHANGRGYNTAAALEIAIPKLRAMGYSFVTVSELIAAGRPVIVDTCYDSHPGDTDKYDWFFRSTAARSQRQEPPHVRTDATGLPR